METWTSAMHSAAEQELSDFQTEFNTAISQWRSSVAAGNLEQGQAQVDDVLRRWRGFTERLQTASLMATANGSIMDRLTNRMDEVGELKETLAKMRERAGTRIEQATSVNPKITESPYINILGLQRIFHESTRNTLLALSIVIGILSLVILGFLLYRIIGGSGLSSLLSGDVTEASTKFRTFAQSYQP